MKHRTWTYVTLEGRLPYTTGARELEDISWRHRLCHTGELPKCKLDAASARRDESLGGSLEWRRVYLFGFGWLRGFKQIASLTCHITSWVLSWAPPALSWGAPICDIDGDDRGPVLAFPSSSGCLHIIIKLKCALFAFLPSFRCLSCAIWRWKNGRDKSEANWMELVRNLTSLAYLGLLDTVLSGWSETKVWWEDGDG